MYLKNGGSIRWINTAGFEICMANGKHILIDPFISGKTSDGIVCHPMALDEIKECSYLLLSHTHSDHAEDVGRIQEWAISLQIPSVRSRISTVPAFIVFAAVKSMNLTI